MKAKNSFVSIAQVLLALSIGGASAAPPPEPTKTLLTTFDGIGFGSTVGPDGMLYVTDPTHGQIVRVNPAAAGYAVFASGLPKTPTGWGDGGTFDVTLVGNAFYALVSEVSPDTSLADSSLDLHGIDGNYRTDRAVSSPPRRAAESPAYRDRF